MPRINPWDDRIPTPQTDRTLTVALPEMETELVLSEASDDFRLGQIKDLYDNYVALYVPQRGQKARMPLLTPKGPVPASRELLQTVSAVEVMQTPKEGELPFSLPELLGIVKKLPERWDEIKVAAIILTNPAPAPEGDEGNSPAGPTTNDSEPT